MNSCDNQTKWLIAIILVGSALIIGGAVGTYDAIDNTRETLKNETTIQESEGEGDSVNFPVGIGGGELTPVLSERHLTWPDADWTSFDEGHCLLVVVQPGDNQPDRLHNDNTIKMPLEMCWAVVKTLQDLIDDGALDREGIEFYPDK